MGLLTRIVWPKHIQLGLYHVYKLRLEVPAAILKEEAKARVTVTVTVTPADSDHHWQ